MSMGSGSSRPVGGGNYSVPTAPEQGGGKVGNEGGSNAAAETTTAPPPPPPGAPPSTDGVDNGPRTASSPPPAGAPPPVVDASPEIRADGSTRAAPSLFDGEGNTDLSATTLQAGRSAVDAGAGKIQNANAQLNAARTSASAMHTLYTQQSEKLDKLKGVEDPSDAQKREIAALEQQLPKTKSMCDNADANVRNCESNLQSAKDEVAALRNQMAADADKLQAMAKKDSDAQEKRGGKEGQSGAAKQPTPAQAALQITLTSIQMIDQLMANNKTQQFKGTDGEEGGIGGAGSKGNL